MLKNRCRKSAYQDQEPAVFWPRKPTLTQIQNKALSFLLHCYIHNMSVCIEFLD